MGARFRRSRRGPITVTFDEVETSILDTLLSQLLDLLDAEDRPLGRAAADAGDDELQRLLSIGTATEPPADPALARLFPNGYRDDREAAAEFRRYTEPDLREGKRVAARTAGATLRTPGVAVKLDDEQARCWLTALNDLRLAIGTRLEVTEDYDELYASMPPDDPRRPSLDVYMWLGHLQETLVRALW
jgi:Domain of unknown function (DUF2017)